MTGRCSAKGCDREATSEAAGLLCAVHHFLLKRGKRVKLHKEAPPVVRAAVTEMRKAAAEERRNAAQKREERKFASHGGGKQQYPSETSEKQASPDQWKWRIAIATAGFTALVLLVEAIERLMLDIPGGIGAVSWQSVDIVLDNAIPVLVFLLFFWTVLALFSFLSVSVVGSILRASLYALQSPVALLTWAMKVTKAAIWSAIHLNWLHGMIPYKRGEELAARDHTPTPAFEVLIARYRGWVQKKVDIVESWRSRWKLGRYLMPESLSDWVTGFLDKGWHAGRVAVLLIVPSALGVSLISTVRVNELNHRLTRSDPCATSDQKWYGLLTLPIRIHVVCGQLVFDNRYPSLASGLGYDPEFVNLARSAKPAPTEFRSERVAYIKDFGSWALVARPDGAEDEGSETIVVRLLAWLPLNWDWVERQLARISLDILENGFLDRIGDQREWIEGGEERDKPDPLFFAVDRSRIVEFVEAPMFQTDIVETDRGKDDDAEALSLVASTMPERDRGKLAVILAARTPDEWTKQLNELRQTVKRQSEAFASYQRQVSSDIHLVRAANFSLAELAAGNLTNVQRLSQDVWRLSQSWRSMPVVCPIVRRDCPLRDLVGSVDLLPELTAVNSQLSILRGHLDNLAIPRSVKLVGEATGLIEAVDLAVEKLHELPETQMVDFEPGAGRQQPDQYVFDLDIDVAKGWTFGDVVLQGEGRGGGSLVQTIVAECTPLAAATFPTGVWGYRYAAWKLPISGSNPVDWLDVGPGPNDTEAFVDRLKLIEVTDGRVFVIGSADQVGTPSRNLDLARKRARSVKTWVTTRAEWSPKIVTAISVGDMDFLLSGVLREGEKDEWQRSAFVYQCEKGDKVMASAQNASSE